MILQPNLQHLWNRKMAKSRIIYMNLYGDRIVLRTIAIVVLDIFCVSVSFIAQADFRCVGCVRTSIETCCSCNILKAAYELVITLPILLAHMTQFYIIGLRRKWEFDEKYIIWWNV